MMENELSPVRVNPTASAPLVLSNITGPRPARLLDITGWLRKALNGGPRLTSEVIAEAAKSGISRSALYRHLDSAGVLSAGTGQRRPRAWFLATQLPQLQQSSSRRSG